MRAFVLVLMLSAFVIAPTLAILPEADACITYEYYCPAEGQFRWACSTQIPAKTAECTIRVLDP
jgi:hypothetical protein